MARVSTRICPVCGSDYSGWVERCASCGVALVALADAPDPLRLPEDQQVVYELGVWPLGLQAAAAQAMAESGIPHGWDGTDLVVHLDHEAAVDALLEEIESAQPGVVGADWLDEDAATAEPPCRGGRCSPRAPGAGERTEAELDDADWRATTRRAAGRRAGVRAGRVAAEDRRLLSDRLDEARVRYRWEGDDVLVVAMADEAAVEALLDERRVPRRPARRRGRPSTRRTRRRSS